MQTYIASQRLKLMAIPVFPRLSLKKIWILGIAVILFLLVWSVFQLNSQTKERYLIGSYQERLAEITKESKTLEINFARADSLVNIDKYTESQNFVKANKIEYVRVLEGTVFAK